MPSTTNFFCKVMIASALVLMASNAAAQTLSQLPPNSRISLVLRDSLRQGPLIPERQVVIGQLVRSTADSVTIRLIASSEFSVARSGIGQMRVSRGVSRSRSAITAGIGLGLLGAAVALQQSADQHYHRTQNTVAAGGVAFGAGALLGALRPFEQWRRLRN